MIIQYLGNSIAAIFALMVFVMFILAVYLAYKYSEKQLPTTKSLRLYKNYMLFGFAGFSLAIFLFEVSNNGFSWDIFWFSLGLMIMTTIFIYLNYFINLKTIKFLKSRDVQLPPLLIYRLAQYFSRKFSFNKNSHNDKKDRE